VTRIVGIKSLLFQKITMPHTTPRLRLIPHLPADLLALIDGEDAYEARTGRRAAGLRDFFVSGDVSAAWLAQLRAAPSADPWTLGFAVVERASDTVVGTVGFKGPPDADGTVEVAYGIVPACQGQGYATEAAEAAIVFARANARVRRVIAHTLPTPNASTRVLTKLGFTHVGDVVDPDDGSVWRWEQTSG
jgi:ribosomal-protein-alanine N-acetyltransferase